MRPISLLFAALCLMAAAPVDTSYTTPYQALLVAHVRPDGEKAGIRGALVDYMGWGKDTDHAEAIKRLTAANPGKLSGDEATAYWLNAYNLLSVDLIVTHPEADSIKHIGSVLDDPWKTYQWTIAGKPYSLLDIEQEAVRSRPGDERLRFAFATTALSGPDIRYYGAETLNQDLQAQARAFLGNPTKGVHARGTVLEVSRMFKPLIAEFDLKGGLVPFLRTHNPDIPANAMVQGYFQYDWSLNSVEPPPAPPPAEHPPPAGVEASTNDNAAP